MENFRGRFTTLLIFAVTSALAGVIGNRADKHLDNILPFLNQPLTISIGSFATIILFYLISGYFLYRKYNAALGFVADFLELDDSLFRLVIPLYVPANQSQKHEMKSRALKKVLIDLTKLGNLSACGVAIYCPDENDKDYLTTLDYHGRPNERPEQLSFFIGDESLLNAPTNNRGVAGVAFVESKTRVAHVDSRGYSDDRAYFLSSRESMPEYRALICVPITGETPNDRLGVLCSYSKIKNKFDNPETRKIVERTAERVSLILDA